MNALVLTTMHSAHLSLFAALRVCISVAGLKRVSLHTFSAGFTTYRTQGHHYLTNMYQTSSDMNILVDWLSLFIRSKLVGICDDSILSSMNRLHS